MKLSENTIDMIVRAVNLANTLEVEGLIFDKEGVRGYNDDNGVLIAALDDFDFEFETMGLSRLSSLKNKIRLLERFEEPIIEAVQKKDSDIIERLKFSDGGSISFDFRCASVKTIMDIPTKKLNTKPRISFNITDEDVANLVKSMNAMRTQNMTMQGNEDTVIVKFSDDSGDMLKVKLESSPAYHDDTLDSFSITTKIKKMIPIFKQAAQNKSFTVNIIVNDIMYLTIDDIDVLVIPEV
jgi:hypothetical protein